MPPPISFLSHFSFLDETYVVRPGTALGKACLLHLAWLAQALGCCGSQQLCTSWEGTHVSCGAGNGPSLAQEEGGGPSQVCGQPEACFCILLVPTALLVSGRHRPFPGWQLTCLSQHVYLW